MVRMNANELVNRYALTQYQLDHRESSFREPTHLATCPDASANASGRDGVYGCETGCEYVRFTATISCPHGETEKYTFGEFGELASIIEGLTELDK